MTKNKIQLITHDEAAEYIARFQQSNTNPSNPNAPSNSGPRQSQNPQQKQVQFDPKEVTSLFKVYTVEELNIQKPAEGSTKSTPDHLLQDIIDITDGHRNDMHFQVLRSIFDADPHSRVVPLEIYGFNVFGYCNAGHADLELTTSAHNGTGMSSFMYRPPSRRVANSKGQISQIPDYESGRLTWKSHNWRLRLVSWMVGIYRLQKYYIVYDGDKSEDEKVLEFVLDCGLWSSTPRGQIWVYNDGYWQLDSALYQSVMKSKWEDIILPEDFKQTVVNDVMGFFGAEETYRGLGMPWKRGVVFYGPPGNGKTITMKALMKTLYSEDSKIAALPLPSLYVKTLTSWNGPEWSIREIFEKARSQAPCFLIFEDLDSTIDDKNRSFFLNELDGLENNDGVLVLGTTNHLDRLDPGIIKRPSRFDRKYMFDNPAVEERKKYVEYWRNKLKDTPIDFTDELVTELADLMVGFSFAYMKEAFVSTLLFLAGRDSRGDDPDDDDKWAKKFPATIKKQIKLLREQLDENSLMGA